MNIASIVRANAPSRVVLMSAVSFAAAVLVGFSALVKFPVPGSPVPATLQTFALLAFAGLLRRWYAMQMVGWYLALGILGAPFFSGGSGWQYICGSTGGYLAGFALMAAIAGFMRTAGRAWFVRGAFYIAAALAVYIPGVFWLKISTGTGWSQAVSMGFVPFVFADIVKAVAAFAGVSAIRR